MSISRTNLSITHVRRTPLKSTAKKLFSPRNFAICFLVILAILMVVKPAYYLASTRRGLSLFATTVLPSLFPFYFCAIMLTKIGAAKTLSLMFEKPMAKLYRTPKESAYVMLLSMLSGYPVGASCTKELYTAGTIDEKDAKTISAFASTSGPIFILGTLGTAIFSNVWIGVIVLVSHYLGAILNGIIYKNRKEDVSHHSVTVASENVDNVLSSSVEKSTLAMLMLGGYIVLGGILVDTLSLLGVDSAIKIPLGEKAQPIVALIFGTVEMTRGIIECAKCSSLPLGIALASGIVSFGGLSVMLQTHSFLSVCGVKFKDILVRKITQSTISFLIALALGFAFQKFL